MKYCERCMTAFPDDFNVCPRDGSPLRISSELVPGTVLLGKYKILDKIGAGGMAVVYRAQHMAFDEVRAIKVVNAHLLADKDFVNRFRTEAIITRKLQHPNAVRVDDLEATEDGRPFMVMEYVAGRNLRDVMHEEKTLPLSRAVNIARQAVAALGAAHKLGIVHRDIKPDNILLLPQPDGDDMVKVLDFGIATMRQGSAGAGGGVSPTKSGVIVGTPQYLSPEQAAGKKQIDGRADLYSMGMVLYEMVTGLLPFPAPEDPSGFLAHHLNTPPIAPEEAAPEKAIPRGLSKVILRALDKDPADRYQSAEEMIEALDALGQWGANVAGFTLGKEITATATGSVYEAVDPRTERPIVVRFAKLHGRLLDYQMMVTALQKSAEEARGLSSPNIASLLGAGEKDGQFYTLYERVDGVVLRNTLARATALPVSELQDVARQVCMAFAHAHARNVVHGNLHPGNIITEWDGTVKLLDYGTPVFPDDAHAGADRLRYTAPEHAGGDPADVRADLFSLGAVLYEMATGSKAFPGKDAAEVMQQLLSHTPRPAREVYAGVPEGLSMVLEKALAKNPEERYQNAAVLLRDIENYDTMEVKSASAAATPAKGTAPGSGVRAAAGGAAGTAAAKRPPSPPPSFPRAPVATKPVIQAKAMPAKAAPPPPKPAPVTKGGSSRANLIVAAIALVVVGALVVLGVFMLRHKPEVPSLAQSAPATTAQAGAAAGGGPKAAAKPHSSVPAAATTTAATTSAGAAAGSLEIVTTPAGAAIQVDGKDAGSSPTTLRGIEAGAHTVTFTMAGYETGSRSWSIKAGETFHLSVPLTASQPLVNLSSDPAGAAILVDGRATGKTTPAEFPWAAGTHNITVHKEGYLDATVTANLSAGQEYRHSMPLLRAGNASTMRVKGLLGGRPASMGGLKIECSPKGAQVTVNGKAVEKKAPVELNLEPGNYEVVLALPGYRAAKRVVNVTQGSTARIEATLERQ